MLAEASSRPDQGATQDEGGAAVAARLARDASRERTAARSQDSSVDDDTVFEELVATAGECAKDKIKGIESVMWRTHQAGLPLSRVSFIESVVGEVTGLPAKVISDISRSEKGRIGGVLIRTPTEAAVYYIAKVEEAGFLGVYDEGTVFIYEASVPGQAVIDDQEFHARVEDDVLASDIAEVLKGHPLLETARGLKEIFQHVKAKLARPGYMADARPGLNCENGFAAWDPELGKVVLLEHDPAHKARYRAPVEFDETASAPAFLAGLERVVPDQSKRDALQEFFGAMLFGVLPEKDSARRMLIMNGPTRTGKSSLTELLQMIIPASAVSSVPPDEWSSEFGRARLAGAHLNICTELKGDRLP